MSSWVIKTLICASLEAVLRAEDCLRVFAVRSHQKMTPVLNFRGRRLWWLSVLDWNSFSSPVPKYIMSLQWSRSVSFILNLNMHRPNSTTLRSWSCTRQAAFCGFYVSGVTHTLILSVYLNWTWHTCASCLYTSHASFENGNFLVVSVF